MKTVSLTLTPYDLSFIGRDNKRIIEPGDFKVYIHNLESGFKVLGEEEILN